MTRSFGCLARASELELAPTVVDGNSIDRRRSPLTGARHSAFTRDRSDMRHSIKSVSDA